MRGIVWLGSAAAATLIAVVAVIVLRGTAPPHKPAVAVSAPPAATAAAPRPATVTKPAAKLAAPLVKPSFDVVTVDRHGQAVIAGRAAPGDRVRVLEGSKTLGDVTADARGEWVLVPSTPMPPGDRQLTLEATAPDGGPPRRSDDVVALSVIRPTSPGGKPSALAVLLPGNRSQPARVLQVPAWASSIQKLLSIDTASYGADRRLVLSGHAVAGARLRLFAGNQLLGTVTADAAGHWSLASPKELPAGGFELWLEQLAADGTVKSRIGAPFEPPTATALAKGGSYVVRQGNSLWVIARRLYGEGTRYTAIYSANRGLIENPNLIYPGQHFKVPKS